MAFPSPLSLLLLTVILTVSSSVSSNREGDALFSLKRRLSDPNNVLQSWDPTLVNPCTWFHVTCDNSNSVVRLDLGNSNISGTLGPELGELKNLLYLELYNNSLTGKIPENLGDLTELVSLDLYGNKFEGNIPKSLANLTSLRFLRLNNNKLTGSLPRELATLANLQTFDVSNNDLCGTIPADGPFQTFSIDTTSIGSDSSLGVPQTLRCWCSPVQYF